jgi:nucleoside-diphosphate-sugar epimerase
VKFLGLNLDFSIDKARRELGYSPAVDFTDAMKQTIDWFRARELL